MGGGHGNTAKGGRVEKSDKKGRNVGGARGDITNTYETNNRNVCGAGWIVSVFRVIIRLADGLGLVYKGQGVTHMSRTEGAEGPMVQRGGRGVRICSIHRLSFAIVGII